jgi:hypothetical protein
MSVGPAPNISVNGAQNVLCNTQSVVLTATGANAYTWMPGTLVSNSIIVTPSVTSTYSVTGTNGSCAGQAVTTVTVSPPVSLAIAASATQLCYGETVTLTTTGATSYTYQPGVIVTNPLVVTPTVSTKYVVYGSLGACTGSAAAQVNVTPDFTVTATVSEDFVCRGNTVLITSSGANTYTVNPGALTGKFVSVAPMASTMYTITGTTGGCSRESTLFIGVNACDVGLNENEPASSFVYPNPVREKLHVSTSKLCREAAIYNSLGQTVKTHVKGGNELQFDTTGLPTGVYFLAITFGDGETAWHRFVTE